MLPTKQTLIILTMLSASLLVVVGFTYQLSSNVADKTIIRHHEEIATEAADTVEIWMAQQKKILKATIASLSLNSVGKNKDTLGPLHMAMEAGHFSDVYIGTEEDGELIDGAGWEPPLWYDPRWRPWYEHAVAKGELAFTTPYIDLVTYELVIAMVEPLFMNGELMGVIGADTILDTLEENVLRLKISRNSFAFIVEDEGTIIIHPNRDYVMRESIFRVEKDLKERITGFEGELPQSVRFLSDGKTEYILSYEKISGSNWFACVIAPYDEAKSLARENTMIFAVELTLRALGILALIVLFTMVGSSAVVFILGRRYSDTLQKYETEMTGISKDLKWNIIKRKEVEAYYQTLFNVANDAIVISKDMRVAECNKKAEEMFALSADELLEKTLIDLSTAYQADGTSSAIRLKEIIEDARKGGQQVFRWSFIRANGSECPASVSIKSFELKEEKLLFLSIRDISKRIDAEAQLMQAHKMAAIGEMLGIIAHQWRQPLNTLSTYISSLQAAQYNDMLSRSFVDKIVSGADGQIKFMSKTIDDFRNFFKPSKTKSLFNVFDVIMSAVKLMEAQIKDANIKLQVKNLAGVSAITVYGYKSEFVHVLVNIIANSRDALRELDIQSPEPLHKKIEIEVRCDEEFVIIGIRDNGTGIPEHILPHIFNPYYTTKSSQSGTGIGLYMAKMIVEKEMNGKIGVTSSTGSTSFTITLRRISEEDEKCSPPK